MKKRDCEASRRHRSICKYIKSVLKKVFSARSKASSESTDIVRPYQNILKSAPVTENSAIQAATNILTWQSGYRLENGEFTIEAELGRGGFGVTYLARDNQGDRFVIKTISNQIGSQTREQWAEFWENFANEAVKLAACGGRNPHIVKLYEVIRDRGLPCIVMEYIEGETLAEIVEREVLEEAQALKYIIQIGTALSEIHRQGLLHRDVKPANIMVRHNGNEAVLIDFGIARKFASGVTQTYLPAVTPGYAPIEQYQWRSIQDTYTDVYALSATLYFALTGKKPVTADMRMKGIPLTPVSQIVPDISPKVDRAIIRGLSLKGKDRPYSVQLFMRELAGESEEIDTVIVRRSPNKIEPGYPEGSLSIDSPYYIERPEVDRVLAREIIKPGAIVRIKAARLMGKTSLISRLLNTSSQQLQGCTVQLNLLEVNQEVLSDPDWFLRWMCARIARELKLPHQLKRWEDELYSPTSNCTYYFEEYLLPQLNRPLVLSLDEVDRLFPYPQAADFFGMLRVWHDKASNSKLWQQLRLIVAHSTEVYVKLKLVQSPFNVGVGKDLTDFNLEQTIDLASRYQLYWHERDAAELMQQIGGHPHLLRLAIYHIARGEMTTNTLLPKLLSDEGIYSNHLRRFLWSLQQDSKLIEAYRQVVHTSSGVQLNYQEQLWLSRMGLIRINPAGLALPRCNLYRQYFSRVLGRH